MLQANCVKFSPRERFVLQAITCRESGSYPTTPILFLTQITNFRVPATTEVLDFIEIETSKRSYRVQDHQNSRGS